MKAGSENGSKGSETAERKCMMLKRVLAWIILIGFVLLLLNIAIFHFYWQVSLAVYVVIIIFFVLSNGKIVPVQTETCQSRANSGNDDDAPDIDGDERDADEDEKGSKKGSEKGSEKGKDQ
jgi:hypothetical protein